MLSAVLVAIGSFIFSVISVTAVVWAPLFFGYLAFFLWHHFVEERFLGGIEWILLEIHVPREMKKTPLTMELFLTNALYHKSQKGGWESYWQGAIHFFYSLEIVSIDGKLHFYIRIPSRLKGLVESQLYAQYPQVRVEVVPDYTEVIPRYKQDGDWYMWGANWALAKPDPEPIRTYADFGLDKVGVKEEDKIDPLAATLEFMGAIKRGQQVWIQHIIRWSKKSYHTHGTSFQHHDFYQESENYLFQLLEPYSNKKPREDGTMVTEIRAPDFLKDDLMAIRHKAEKLVFDIGIRLVVLSNKNEVTLDEFNNTRRASRLLFRQYSDMTSNRLERYNATQYDYPWSDPTGKLLERLKHRHLTSYKLRMLFYPPILTSFDYPEFISNFMPSHKPKISVMNTEEIATLFHFPGLVSETPSFTRLESKTAKPPSNLPM